MKYYVTARKNENLWMIWMYNGHRHMHRHVYTSIYFPSLSSKTSRSNHNSVPVNTCTSHILVSKYQFSNKRNMDFLEKWLIPRLGRERTKWAWNIMRYQKAMKWWSDGNMSKDAEASFKGLPLAKSGTMWSPKWIMTLIKFNHRLKQIFLSPY